MGGVRRLADVLRRGGCRIPPGARVIPKLGGRFTNRRRKSVGRRYVATSLLVAAGAVFALLVMACSARSDAQAPVPSQSLATAEPLPSGPVVTAAEPLLSGPVVTAAGLVTV